MGLDQPGHTIGKGRFLTPAQQNLFGHIGPQRIVAVIGITAFLFTADAGQALGDVMK